MVMTIIKTISDDYVTMTTKNVPPTSISEPLSDTVSTSSAAVAAGMTGAAQASSLVVPASTAPFVSRERLFNFLKVAMATSVGIVFGAGAMYVYLTSFSNVGKEINDVVQSVNILKSKF